MVGLIYCSSGMTIFLVVLFFPMCLCYLDDGSKGIRRETACDGYEMKITCPGTELINIEMATYGRHDDSTCVVDKALMSDTHCTLGNAMQIISSKCDGKSMCTFSVGQPDFPDPCPGTKKYVTAMWYCIPAIVSCPGPIKNVSLSSSYLIGSRSNKNMQIDGAWVRDPLQNSQRIYFMSYSRFDTPSLYEYGSIQSFINNQPSTFYHLQQIDGTGFTVYDGFLYYNPRSSRTVVKYDLGTNKIETQTDLINANYHDTSPYAVQLATDIDMAVDENGLWVIYATEGNKGNIVLTRLHKQTLHRLSTWYTSYEKLSALNAFVACGVLYVVNYDRLVIDYIYNTTSKTEARVNIPIPGLNRTTSALDYNPKDRMLYVWDNGVASLFELHFNSPQTSDSEPSLPHPTIRPLSPPTTTSVQTPTPTQPQNPNPFPPTPPIPSNSPQVKTFCVGKVIYGLHWPNVTYSDIAVLKCPGSSSGKATWACGGTRNAPQWTTRHPDMFQCLSSTVKALKEEMNTKDTSIVDMCQSYAEKLLENEDDLTTWDLVELVRLLKHCIRKSSTDRSSASAIADAVLKITNVMLRPSLALKWDGLERKLQTETAVSLTSSLEEAAFFLARDMTTGRNLDVYDSSSQSNSVTWSQPYVTMAIRIEPVLKSSSKKNSGSPTPNPMTIVTHNSGHGDTVVVNDQSIAEGLKAMPGQNLAIVYLSMKNIGKHIVDSLGFGSVQFPVGSRVLSISAKSMDKDGNWLNRGRSLNLSRPITLQLWHDRNNLKNHACVFWNEKSRDASSWSRYGCKRVSGNDSYSVCQCNHLTSFAVLSSNEEFPLMGAEPGFDAEPLSVEFLNYLNVVRGGMIVSVIFLIMTFVALFHIKTTPDLNTIHKNLIASLTVTELVFLIGITQVQNQPLCTAIAVLLHYGVLAIFTWAAMESFHHLSVLSKFHETTNRWKYYYVVGYLIPAVIVAISVGIDHSAFGTQTVCWIRTSDSFIWAFVGPCCLAIAASVIFIAILLCKLSKERTPCDEEVLPKKRCDAATTCITMFLLCMMWSSAFVWIAGFSVGLTAWIFSLFSAATAVGCFILYCIVSPDANLIRERFSSCLRKRSDSDYPRRSQLGVTQNASQSEYRKRTGNPSMSTLLASTNSQNSTLSKIDGVDVEMQPLVRHLQYGFTGHVTGGGRRSTIDVTDPKLPGSHSYMLNKNALNDYVRKKSRSLADHNVARGANMRGVSGDCPHCYGSHPGLYCGCDTSTYKSGCYDRLHEDPLPRGNSQCVPVCEKCMLQKMPKQHTTRPRPVSHQYETLGPFFDEYEEGTSNPIHSCHLNRRHPYEEMHSGRVRNQQEMIAPPHPGNSHDIMHNFMCLNDSGMRTEPIKRSSRIDPKFSVNGRHSDPLSADQGYDTDSQQPSQFLNHGSHGEAVPNRSSPRTRGLLTPLGTLKEKNRNSLSAGSDSVSENDREVETINYSTNQPIETTAFSQQTYVTSAVPSPPPLSTSHEEHFNPRLQVSSDTQNAFDTARSWAALSGTHLKSSYPINKHQKSSRKTTADPHIILAQARLKAARNSVDSCGSGGLEDKPLNGYTLPGTATSDTKARIDLRSGGVSMTTNI